MNCDEKKTQSAPMVVQMLIYAVILFVSYLLSSLLPKSFPIPTPVIGLVLLYALLSFHIIKVEWVDSLGSALISLIGFMFVPSGISLAQNLDIFANEGIKVIIVILLSTIILLVATSYTAKGIIALTKKLRHRQTSSQKGDEYNEVIG